MAERFFRFCFQRILKISWTDQLDESAGLTSSLYLKPWLARIFEDWPFSLYIVAAFECDEGLVSYPISFIPHPIYQNTMSHIPYPLSLIPWGPYGKLKRISKWTTKCPLVCESVCLWSIGGAYAPKIRDLNKFSKMPKLSKKMIVPGDWFW